MVDKVFHRFESDGAKEAVIGGLVRHARSALPDGLEGTPTLVVPGDPATVAAFRAAAAGRPLVIEVGTGKGRFIVELASARPDTIFLGLETRLGFNLEVQRRAGKRGLANVWSTWGDARVTMPLLVDPGQASEGYLLFPDPWWKHKHARRRHGAAMIGAFATALAPGGRMVVKSDIEEYRDVLAATFAADPRFAPAPMPADLPLTDRERRIVRDGTNVFAAAFVRQ
jgi:tRNA (guanine-N7-)-methyltransferase